MRKSKQDAFEIPTILESLKADVDAGKITLHDAAIELCKAGWLNFVDIESTRELLRL